MFWLRLLSIGKETVLFKIQTGIMRINVKDNTLLRRLHGQLKFAFSFQLALEFWRKVSSKICSTYTMSGNRKRQGL
nr:MAG TPA: hypothetical protein [Caudoviricetes sp.]